MTKPSANGVLLAPALPKKKWILPLVLGASLPCVIWYGYQRVYPPIDPHVAAVARHLGYDERTYSDASELLGKADKKQINDADWKRLVGIYQDETNKPTIRETAIMAMMLMDKTPHRAEILRLVRPVLVSKDPDLEASALTLIWRFDEPDWRQQAMNRKFRTEPGMKLVVGEMLSRGSFRRPRK